MLMITSRVMRRTGSFGRDTLADAIWVVITSTLILMNYVKTAQGVEYYLHHYCNQSLSLGPNEVGQIRITNEMPDKKFRPQTSIGDCQVHLTTAFDDERIRMQQRPVDLDRYETGTVTLLDGSDAVGFPATSTGRKVTIKFETDDVKNIFAVEVILDFAVLADPWLLQEQVSLNSSLLISLLVILILLQLVILFKLCRAERRHLQEGGAPESGLSAKPSANDKEKGSAHSGRSATSSASSTLKAKKRDYYGAPAESPQLNRIPPMDKRNKQAALQAQEDKEDNYYIK